MKPACLGEGLVWLVVCLALSGVTHDQQVQPDSMHSL
jgi:hypothetical protein